MKLTLACIGFWAVLVIGSVSMADFSQVPEGRNPAQVQEENSKIEAHSFDMNIPL